MTLPAESGPGAPALPPAAAGAKQGTLLPSARNSFLDGDVLSGFAGLSRGEQARLAGEAGLQAAGGAEAVLADLAALDSSILI